MTGRWDSQRATPYNRPSPARAKQPEPLTAVGPGSHALRTPTAAGPGTCQPGPSALPWCPEHRCAHLHTCRSGLRAAAGMHRPFRRCLDLTPPPTAAWILFCLLCFCSRNNQDIRMSSRLAVDLGLLLQHALCLRRTGPTSLVSGLHHQCHEAGILLSGS